MDGARPAGQRPLHPRGRASPFGPIESWSPSRNFAASQSTPATYRASAQRLILRGCDLSNVDGREGSLRRVEIHGSRLLGFGLAGGTLQDVRVLDSSLALSLWAFSKLKDVIFERVDLTETSFMEAQMERVIFIDCKLAGTDFRGVKQRGCTIRGTSLDGILGIDSLRGITMPWPDVVDSAAALAAAVGINIKST